jgi:hypothetical protein
MVKYGKLAVNFLELSNQNWYCEGGMIIADIGPKPDEFPLTLNSF